MFNDENKLWSKMVNFLHLCMRMFLELFIRFEKKLNCLFFSITSTFKRVSFKTSHNDFQISCGNANITQV